MTLPSSATVPYIFPLPGAIVHHGSTYFMPPNTSSCAELPVQARRQHCRLRIAVGANTVVGRSRQEAQAGINVTATAWTILLMDRILVQIASSGLCKARPHSAHRYRVTPDGTTWRGVSKCTRCTSAAFSKNQSFVEKRTIAFPVSKQKQSNVVLLFYILMP